MKKQILRLVMLLIVLCGMNVFSSCLEEKQEVVIDLPIPPTMTTRTAIDLGLSVKWANMNIGATRVTDYGDYYAWGEIHPQSDNGYTWSTYKWCEGKENTLTKYCTDSNYGKVDGKTILDPEDDAATASWGSEWRMPTSKEMFELRSNCFWIWTNSYNNTDVAGYIVYKVKKESDKGVIISRKDEVPENNYSLSDSHIFMPAAGHLWNAEKSSEGTICYYWDSDLDINHNDRSASSNDRFYGQSVRAVYTK